MKTGVCFFAIYEPVTAKLEKKTALFEKDDYKSRLKKYNV